MNGQDASVLDGALAYGGTAQGAINAGKYDIVPSGLASRNYAIRYLAGSLAVDQAFLLVAAGDAAKTYDGLAFTGGRVSYTGFVHGETASVLGGALVFGGNSQGAFDVGTYQITASGLTSANYAIAYVPATLSVAKAPLTIVANGTLKDYDGQPYAGGNGVSFRGFVGGQTASVLGGSPAYGGSSQGATDIGNYDITASGFSSRNYDLTYLPGVLTIAKLPAASKQWPSAYLDMAEHAGTSRKARGGGECAQDAETPASGRRCDREDCMSPLFVR